MDMIKDLIKGYYPLLIAGACVLFVIGVFFSNTTGDGMGVFGNAGAVYEPMMDIENSSTNGPQFIGNTGANAGDVPVIKYAAGAKEVGDILTFKDLLKVQMSDGSFVSGSAENGFAIYLVDIRNSGGISELLFMSGQEIEDLDEIPASFLYDKENDKLHLHKSGTYTVIIKIYGSTGGFAEYEFKLPVEAGN